MPYAQVEVDELAYKAGIDVAFEELRAVCDDIAGDVADKWVEYAKVFAPKRTERLEASIHRDPVVREGVVRAVVEVIAGGPGIREAVPMEFGTYKDRPRAYMRRAAALAVGGLRSVGVAARLDYSERARRFRKRAQARLRVQRLQRRRRGGVQLTAAEARVVAREISSRLRYRGERTVRGRR